MDKRGLWLGSMAVVALVAGCSGGGDDDDSGSATTKGKPLNVPQSVAVAAATKLHVSNSYGNVTVRGQSSASQVVMTPTLHSADPEVGNIEVTVDGDTLNVVVSVDAGSTAQVDLNITTPQNLRFAVVTGDGAVDLSGMVGSGQATTGAGDCTVDMDLGTNGSLALTTGGGDISLTIPATTAGALNAVSTGGASVSVSSNLNFSGMPVMGTASGNLNGGGSVSIDLTTGSGSIRVTGR